MYNDDNNSIQCSVDTSYEPTVASNSACSISSRNIRNKKEEVNSSLPTNLLELYEDKEAYILLILCATAASIF